MTPLTTNYPASFTYNDKKYKAIATKISLTEVNFYYVGMPEDFFFRVNNEIEYNIKTPYGISTCIVKNKWAHKIDDGLVWGGKITKISEDKNDPLRCIIDSPF